MGLLLICLGLSLPIFGQPQPTMKTPSIAAEQVAKVTAILATVKVNDETSQVAAEDALVKEGSAILQALQAVPVIDTGKPDMPELVRWQALVVREAIVRLTWGNPREVVQQALVSRAKAEQRDPATMFAGYPELITDPQVIRAFPQCLFYVVRILLPGADLHHIHILVDTTPRLLVVRYPLVARGTSMSTLSIPGDTLQLTWISKPTELAPVIKAYAPILPLQLFSSGRDSSLPVPLRTNISDVAYSWVRIYEMLVYGTRLIINPEVKVQMPTVTNNNTDAYMNLHASITGTVTAATLPPSGLTGNDLSGILITTISYDTFSGRLADIISLDKIARVPIAADTTAALKLAVDLIHSQWQLKYDKFV